MENEMKHGHICHIMEMVYELIHVSLTLSIVIVLVTAHTMFSISLLGVGSPIMGHHFQVQVACLLQGHSLRG